MLADQQLLDTSAGASGQEVHWTVWCPSEQKATNQRFVTVALCGVRCAPDGAPMDKRQ